MNFGEELLVSMAEAVGLGLVVWSLNSATNDLPDSSAHARVSYRPDLEPKGDAPWAVATPTNSC